MASFLPHTISVGGRVGILVACVEADPLVVSLLHHGPVVQGRHGGSFDDGGTLLGLHAVDPGGRGAAVGVALQARDLDDPGAAVFRLGALATLVLDFL